MRFWDSSALVPLLVDEATTPAITSVLVQDPDFVVWWGSPIECISALSRLGRERLLDQAGARVALERLDVLSEAWHEMQPTTRIREKAIRMLRVHALRAADALQLAAAIVAAEDQPGSLAFVTLDDRLAEAAELEGFSVIPSA